MSDLEVISSTIINKVYVVQEWRGEWRDVCPPYNRKTDTEDERMFLSQETDHPLRIISRTITVIEKVEEFAVPSKDYKNEAQT